MNVVDVRLQQWLGNEISATDWGWQKSNVGLRPSSYLKHLHAHVKQGALVISLRVKVMVWNVPKCARIVMANATIIEKNLQCLHSTSITRI